MLPISDILIRSVTGFLFIIPALALYFYCLRKSGRKQTILHILMVFMFCYYLLGIMTVTGIGYTRMHFRPRLSLIPLLGMVSGPVDTMLNILLFVPLGFFLPLLYPKFRSIGTVALSGFLLSLSVELLQLFDWGTTDINDLVTNTLGACLGFFAYHLMSRCLTPKWKKRCQAENVCDRLEVLALVIYTVFVMVTIQPWVIGNILN